MKTRRIAERLVGPLCFVLLLAFVPWAAWAQSQCVIDGPARINVNQTFSLCGPVGDGLEYVWRGPGVENSRQRCVTVIGRGAGSYTYELVTYLDGRVYDRCTHRVQVGSGAGGSLECDITGPTSIRVGQSATLCAPSSSLHTYEWRGPAGYLGSGRCITVSREGAYDLTIRNTLTGYTRECSHRLDVIDGPVGGDGMCSISGPRTISTGRTARLCAEGHGANDSFRWTGPNGEVRTGRCIEANRAGTWTLTVSDSYNGAVERCTWALQSDDGSVDDPDSPYTENCPRTIAFWRQQCSERAAGAQRQISLQDLRRIAQRVDERSSFFNWTNDQDGLCKAMWPATPLTYRKHLARHHAALLANVAAAELGVTTTAGGDIGLTADTEITFRTARTIDDLIRQADQALRSGRTNFMELTRFIQRVNSGQGIGPVCNQRLYGAR